MSEPRVVKRVTQLATPWFDIVAKTVEGWIGIAGQPYYVVRPPDYVVVLGCTDEGDVPLVRQYRPAVEEYTLELPSGHVELGEDPEVAAKRELFEETGYGADHVELLGILAPDTGRLANQLWCYLAKDVVLGGDEGWRNEEGIAVVLCPKQELLNLVASGQLRHAHDLATIALAFTKHNWGVCDVG